MNDRLPEERSDLERDYAELSWPAPTRDVVRDALALGRPIRFPAWRLAVAAALALCVCGWWLVRTTETPDAAALAWDGDAVLAEDLDRLQARIEQRPVRPSLSVSRTQSHSSRTASLRRRMDRLKRNIEPIPPKAGVPVGTHGENEDETEIA